MTIAAAELTPVLREIIAGRQPITVTGRFRMGMPTIVMGDWRLIFCTDAGSEYTLEAVTHADGRSQQFDGWFDYDGIDPPGFFGPDEQDALFRRIDALTADALLPSS